MALRKQLKDKMKEVQERKRRHFLVYWPEEDCYSEVPQAKVVGEPSDKIQIKERGKIYTGQLVGVGSKEEIQQRLNSILGESSQQPTASTTDKPAQPETSQEKVKKRKRAVEKATKQKSTDGKPPKKKQKRDGGTILRVVAHDHSATVSQAATVTTTAPSGSQAATVTTTAPSGSLAATVTTTAPSGSLAATVTTTALNGSQAATVTTTAPSGSLAATVTTTAPSGSLAATVTTTALNGSQAATVTTTAPSGSLAATMTTTTAPSGSQAVASAPAVPTAPGGSTTTTGALSTSVITLPCTQAPSSSGSQTTVTRIAPVHSGATTSATPIIVTDSDLEDDYSDISSVPPLRSPLPPLTNSDVSPAKQTESHSLESLGIEMELQYLSDKVTIMEANYDRVLRKQDEIISRLAALERQLAWQQMSTPHGTSYQSFDEMSETESFSFNQPPAYIPPPPQHPPPRPSFLDESAENQTPSREFRAQRRIPAYPLPSHPSQPIPLPPHAPQPLPPQQDPSQLISLPSHPSQPRQFEHRATQDQTQLRAEPRSLFSPPPRPPKRFVLAGDIESGLNRAPTQGLQTRQPFQPITNQANATVSSKTSIRTKPGNTYLPSSTINKQKLKSASDVILKYPKLRSPSSVGTLATKLAREAFFGEEVLAKCTVAGDRDLPGLPIQELQQLKQTLLAQFPEYWRSPYEFEPLWKTSSDSIGQLCKRLRSKF